MCASITDIDALIPELREPARALVDLAGRAGVLPRITSTLRTRHQQECLYRRWKQGLNPYPVAPPGTSAHEFGYAFDMIVVGDDNQNDLGQVWQSWGGLFGGQRDPVHFEYPGFSPTGTARANETRQVPLGVSLIDMALGFGEPLSLEAVTIVMNLFGIPEPTALKYLTEPASTLFQHHPWAYELLSYMPGFTFLRYY